MDPVPTPFARPHAPDTRWWRRLDRIAASPVGRYCAAVALILIAFAVTEAAKDALSSSVAVIFVAAVALAAWLGGLGPGLLAAALAVALLNYYLIPPTHRLTFDRQSGAVLAVLALVSVLISSLNMVRRRALEEQRRLGGRAAEELARRTDAERALAESEVRYRTIVETANEGIWLIDPDAGTIFANDRMAAMLGTSAAALVGRRVPEFVFPEDRAGVADRIGANLAGRFETFDFCFRREDGGEVPVLAATSPVRDAAGMVVGALGMFADASDRRRAEERDRALAAIVTTSDDAIVTKTLDGTVTSWNPAAERLYGWIAAEMIGHSIARIVPSDKRQELADILARLRRGERIDHHDTARVTKDGRRLDVSVSISPLVDAAGRVVGASKIARDVTDRKQAESLREEFLASISHDLNNPLAGLKATAQLLLRPLRRGEVPDPARLEQGLVSIDRLAARMAGLIDELFDAARLRAGQPLELAPERVDLVALARHCVELYRAATQDHQLRCVSDVPELVGTWDSARLERVLTNLLSNALKYSPGGGDVEVRVAWEEDAAGSWAILSVRDEGIGIPAADLPHVFDRYRRGSNVGGLAGTGLGLAGVQQIVDQHGGTVAADSIEERGSTVTVRLPIVPDTGGEAPAAPPIPRSGRVCGELRGDPSNVTRAPIG